MCEKPASLYSVAPMMQVTDRHWRYMARGLTRRTLLYTEMCVDQALVHNENALEGFLGHSPEEAPIAVQLGGNDPETLKRATELVVAYFGDSCVEVNLNCGCPSHVVAGRNCFGARLMTKPSLVRQIVHEMSRVSRGVPITVKHRLGTDLSGADYETTLGFCREVSEAGVRQFAVHTRMAILGRRVSTEQNRSIPPLVHETAHRLSRDMPECEFFINGGLKSLAECAQHIDRPDSRLAGAMVGRAAWTSPLALLAKADTTIFGASSDPCTTPRDLVERYADYADRRFEICDDPTDNMTLLRPLHYIFTGVTGNRQFRTCLVAAASRDLKTVYSPSAQREALPSHHIYDALEHISPEDVDRPLNSS